MHDELRRRLESFRIDLPGTNFPFVRRLAHENGWSAAFAQRVIDEYFRFVWLAMRAGHPVTPSPAVDEAWHLHLCYTQSYWDELCGAVLGKPLHHGPTRGGVAEAAKYADWYARTLASYRESFGEPPADIWPPVGERFRGSIPRKVDARAHWIVPKAMVQRAAVTVGAAVGLLGLATACTPSSNGGGNLMTIAFVMMAVMLVFAMVLLVVRVRVAPRHGGAARGRRSGDAGNGVGGGCSPPWIGTGMFGVGGEPGAPHGHGVHGHDHDRGHLHGHGDGHGHGHGHAHGHDAHGDSGGGGASSDAGGSGGGGDAGGGGGGCGGGGGGGGD